ncbi:hypothetical protein JSQ81_05655 [Sporosarcina sp. Marseille-Q4063]|uniref:three component ABC system middle component n=1 Tax=Sporosarcina sp. Marseille-Q4063 TaxID=2810514 RepID=UPI001BB0B115|nr:three component ABC system middle component [Sporosarcina sp. Marseille-Q4063]QUW23055.1 hypothetical protein JSQ81_05655 [Sporosarcina sp. Marseille-Q4063]
MKINKDTYNNELIGLISILSVLSKTKRITITKALLIIPFYTHQQSLKVLKNKIVKIRSIEEFIIKYPSYFSNYNERFHSLLTLSINSIILLNKMEIIFIEDSLIILNEEIEFSYKEKDIGKRALEIIKASDKLSQILLESDENLYLQLRVEI